MRKLKDRCPSCGKAVDPTWRLCPYCEAETGATPPSAGRRRRRNTTTSSEEVVTEAPPPRSKSSR